MIVAGKPMTWKYALGSVVTVLVWSPLVIAQSPDGEIAGDSPAKVTPHECGDIDIRANDTRLVDILRELSEATGRNFVIAPDVHQTRVTVSLGGMTLIELLDAMLPTAGCKYEDHGKYIVVQLAGGESVAGVPTEMRVVTLKYVRASLVVEMITPFLSNQGRAVASPDAETGIDSDETGGDSLAGEDFLIVEDTADRLEEVLRVIEEIDVQPAQVLVEATIIRAALSDDTQLGIDFTFLAGVDFENVGSTSPAGFDLATGTLPAAQLQNTTTAVGTNFDIPLNVGGFTFGLIKNNVAVFLRALEELTDTVVVANPKILTLNKQRGEVIVGRRDGFITTTVTETAAIQAVEFLETGTQLRFRPFVLGDDQVRMEIHVEDSAGGLTTSDLPFEATTESTSNVLVRNGHTILIGGLFRTRDDVSRSQAPGLGEIPILGAAFRRTQDTSQREEVMVLLTVHVVSNPELMEELGDQMLEEIDAIRLGNRERIQWFGRRRLAEAHLASAIDDLEQGKMRLASYHARLARSADPVMSDARRLWHMIEHELDVVQPDNELRDWVARQLNAKPAFDPKMRRPVEVPGAYFRGPVGRTGGHHESVDPQLARRLGVDGGDDLVEVGDE